MQYIYMAISQLQSIFFISLNTCPALWRDNMTAEKIPLLLWPTASNRFSPAAAPSTHEGIQDYSWASIRKHHQFLPNFQKFGKGKCEVSFHSLTVTQRLERDKQ